jgi:type VI secretion system secreted protein Hcp
MMVPYGNPTSVVYFTFNWRKQMAIDVYLQIDGIKGESQDDKHKEWIEVTGVHWGIHQPRSATASTSGGHTAERVEMSDIAFSKLMDLSSPILARPVRWAKRSPRPSLSSSVPTVTATE